MIEGILFVIIVVIIIIVIHVIMTIVVATITVVIVIVVIIISGNLTKFSLQVSWLLWLLWLWLLWLLKSSVHVECMVHVQSHDCCGQVLFEAFLFCFLFCVERHENCSDLLRTKNNVFWFEKIVDKREKHRNKSNSFIPGPQEPKASSYQALPISQAELISKL